MPAHYQAAFAPEWADLWQLLPTGTNAMRCGLSRLMHFCSAQGIHPGQVNDKVLTVFHDALITESIVEQPYLIIAGPPGRGTMPASKSSAGRNTASPFRRFGGPFPFH